MYGLHKDDGNMGESYKRSRDTDLIKDEEK